MGPTGVGKSKVRILLDKPRAIKVNLSIQFVNTASGSDLPVSDNLESCTQFLQHSRLFKIDGKQVILVDSPGFNDTNKSDLGAQQYLCGFLEYM